MESRVIPPSTAELDLLLHWPDRRTRPQWVAIFSASIVLHVGLFFAGTRVPSLIHSERPTETARVERRRVPLYFPPSPLTQRAPNQKPVSKEVRLADFEKRRAAQQQTANGKRRPETARASQTPAAVQQPAKNEDVAKNVPPQILPQTPAPTSKAPEAPRPGIPAPATAPPASQNPFSDIGGAPAPNPHPKLTPPKTDVSGSLDGLTQLRSGRQLTITDDVPAQPVPGAEPHAAVELQSDPSGADFRAYLRNILTIVRGNWRRVIPESARMGSLRGRTVVEFVVTRDGGIPKLVVSDPSGADPLDRAAVAGLSMSNPLPPLPPDYKGFEVRLAFTFAYNMPAK